MVTKSAGLQRSQHRCVDCGYCAPRWFGRCPECGVFGTASEASEATSEVRVTSLLAPERASPRFSTGLAEVDRVLGGGLVPGSVLLLAGEPGIGKSTIVLQLLDAVLGRGCKTLLVSGEESIAQVGMRAVRLGVAAGELRAAAASSLETVLALSGSEHPGVLVVDSIQTLESRLAGQPAGSLLQVRDCAASLARHAKETGTVVVMVGHVTKDGNVAGPKTLEHMVDVVLTLEGERTGTVRFLRSAKNRFGSCDETGVFVMTEQGLQAVPDPSSMLLADRRPGVPGSAVFPALEGTRPVMVEIQSLVCDTDVSQPRRVAIGIDARRMAMVAGVLGKQARVVFGKRDVFVAAAGGVAVREPAADLALALALHSSAVDGAVDPSLVAIGEIGLAGEIRRVPGVERRLTEAARLGFEVALVPRGPRGSVGGIRTVTVADVSEAIAFAPARTVMTGDGRSPAGPSKGRPVLPLVDEERR